MPPELVMSYVNFCSARQNYENDTLDLREHSFLYPTLLLPSLGFMEQNELKAVVHHEVHGYVETIINPSRWTEKSYVPFRKLPLNKSKREKILNEIDTLLKYPIGGRNAFDYALYELTENIYVHSEFKNGYIMAQRYQKKGFGEICFLDDGITIPGNFKKYGLDYEDDCDAIKQAINGISTKDEFNHRGFSLNTIMSSFTKYGGQMFIASGYGALYVNSVNQTMYRLADKYKLDGTLVSLRVSKKVIMEHEQRGRRKLND